MNPMPRRLRARLPSPPDDPVQRRHQAFIHYLPCLGCGKPAPSECAYVGRLAGLAVPTGDRYLVPLCGPATVWQDCCHSRKHYLGAARFWSELGINPIDIAAQLWRVSGDVTAGSRAVMLARQTASPQRPFRRDVKGSSPGCVLDRGTAQLTAIVTPPMSSELPLLVEHRS